MAIDISPSVVVDWFCRIISLGFVTDDISASVTVAWSPGFRSRVFFSAIWLCWSEPDMLIGTVPMFTMSRGVAGVSCARIGVVVVFFVAVYVL